MPATKPLNAVTLCQVSVVHAGTYVWCFCCGCCCAGRAAAKDMAFQPNNGKSAVPQKRPHRHDSGVDIYANAVFPSITPGMAALISLKQCPRLVQLSWGASRRAS